MSAVPTNYTPSYDFSDFSVANPTQQQSGAQLDAQFNSISALTAAMLARAAEIQRDDGQLKNGIVSLDSLSDAAMRSLSVPTNWTALTAYRVGDQVMRLGVLYYCQTAHTSAASFSSTNWVELGPLQGVDGQDIAEETIPFSKFRTSEGNQYAAPHMMTDAIPEGGVVQTILKSLAGATTCATYIPFDITVPQVTEGNNVASQEITPLYLTSKIRVTFLSSATFTSVASGGAREVIAAAFIGGDTDAFAAAYSRIKNTGAGSNDQYCKIHLCYDHSPGSVSPVEYSIRCGSSGTQSVQIGDGNVFGGAGGINAGSYLLLQEIKHFD